MKNALLTFAGEQDALFFAKALESAVELSQEDSGGSREISVRAERDRLVVGYKKELDV